MRQRQWFPWRLWTWWNARLDGKKNIPPPEAIAVSEIERQIQTAVNTTIRGAEQRYTSRADPLESKLAELRKSMQEIYEPEYNRLQQKAGRRDVLIYMSRSTHLALLFLLTVGEMAFNLVAFNVFQEPAIFTALMALAIGVAIPLCAWGVGVWVRQWPPPWWNTAAKLVVVVGAMVGVLVGINQVRLAYLVELAPEFAKVHPELGLAFFAVNIVILVAAALATYLGHDPEQGFAEAKANVGWCNWAMRRIEGKLDALANAFRTEVEMAKEGGWQLMAYYRMINRRRRDRVPQYFDDDTNKNYRPEFAHVREAAQYHASPETAGAALTEASAQDKATANPIMHREGP